MTFHNREIHQRAEGPMEKYLSYDEALEERIRGGQEVQDISMQSVRDPLLVGAGCINRSSGVSQLGTCVSQL